jgi:hypothetical protein
LQEELFVTASIIPKTGFGVSFKGVISCQAIDIGRVYFPTISLQFEW